MASRIRGFKLEKYMVRKNDRYIHPESSVTPCPPVTYDDNNPAIAPKITAKFRLYCAHFLCNGILTVE